MIDGKLLFMGVFLLFISEKYPYARLCGILTLGWCLVPCILTLFEKKKDEDSVELDSEKINKITIELK